MHENSSSCSKSARGLARYISRLAAQCMKEKLHEVSRIGHVMVQELSVLHKQKEASGGLFLANVAPACMVALVL